MTTRAEMKIRAGALIDKARQLISNSHVPLALGQIFSALVAAGDTEDTRSAHGRFNRHMAKARASGKIDGSLIREGRGLVEGRRRTSNYGGQPPTKFSVGDKVRIDRRNGRTPAWLRQGIRMNQPRTIVAAVPARDYCDGGTRDNRRRYYLGGNHLGDGNLDSHPFRADELALFVKGDVGRPRLKRQYKPKKVRGNSITPSAPLDSHLVGSAVPPSIINADCTKKDGEL